MKTKELKDFKKADWKKIAKKHEVKIKFRDTIIQIVKNIAKSIGVDEDKIKDEDLKKEVYKKLLEIDSDKNNKENVETESKVDNKVEVEALDKEQIDVLEKNHYMKQATALGVNFGFQQSAKDIKDILDYHVKQNPNVKYEPFNLETSIEEETNKKDEEIVDNELSNLQAQCKELGLAYGSAHTKEDLKQLITAIKGSSAINVNPNATKQTAPNPIQQPINENPNQIGQQTAPVPDFLKGQPSPIKKSTQVIKHNPTAHATDVNEVDEGQLNDYRGAIMRAIKNHFRAMTRQEIINALSNSNYPFKWDINNNPENSMQIDITLTSKEKSVRLPSDNKNEWITIGG